MKPYRRSRSPAGSLCLVIALCISGIGLIFLWSITGASRMPPLVQRQLIWVCAGLVAFFVFRSIDYRLLLRASDVFYLLALGMLVVVLLVGREVGGSRRWLSLPGLGFNVQPSEFAKIAVVLILANYLTLTKSYLTLKWLWIPFLICLCPMMLIVKQPDLGTACVFLPILFAMLYLAGVRLRTFLVVGAFILCSSPVVWLNMESYQRERIYGFLKQDSPSPQMRRTILYQLIQSKIAIGSGGLTGKGLGRGTQNRLGFLPNRQTDFPFPVICEEWGFLGALLVFFLYFLLLLALGRIAEKATDPQGSYIVAGVMAMIATQFVVNTGMTAGQFPVVGMTLPLVSYGGSSMLCIFASLGIAASVALHRPRWFSGRRTLERMVVP